MDSPFCRSCLRNGILSQTFRIVRQPSFKCRLCRTISDRADYQDYEMNWRADFATWQDKTVKALEAAHVNVKSMKPEIERVRKVGQK